MKNRVLTLAAVALFVTVLTASAQTGAWTAVGSTGTVNPPQMSLAVVSASGTSLGLNANGTLIARFNVTNTWGGPYDMPPWTTLEVGAMNTSITDTVTATLYGIDPCTGVTNQLCTVINQGPGCVPCSFPSNTFDFGNFLYYVEVSITRTSASGPQLYTLRIR